MEKCVNILKKKHGTTFSQMQYHIWAEMVANEMHSNTDTPPSSSMFKRAGDGGGNSGKRSDSTGITKALTVCVKKLKYSTNCILKYAHNSCNMAC